MMQEETPAIVMIGIDRLRTGESNVRQGVGQIDDLVNSIRQVGILEPLIVRSVGEEFEVVAGSRRLAAARRLGISEVPCIVHHLDDEEAVLVSLTENIQRGDLREEEIVEAFLSLRETNPSRWTPARFAERIGKSVSWMNGLLTAYEALTKLREAGMNITMRFRPSADERNSGAVSVSHLQEVEKAIRAVQSETGFSDSEAAEMRVQLVKAVRDLPREDARLLIDKFRADPHGPLEEKRREIQIQRRGVVFRRTYLPEDIVHEIDAIAESSDRSPEELIPILVQSGLRNTTGAHQATLVEESSPREPFQTSSIPEQYHQQRLWNLIQIESIVKSAALSKRARQNVVYTAGYSQKTIEQFIELLQKAGVNLLIDVRRNPVSQHRPEFSARRLKQRLSDSGIEYVHLPELGVPSRVRKKLYAGEMSYAELFEWYDRTVLETNRLNHLQALIEGKTVCLMCTEISPTLCHRHRIALALVERGWKTLDL
ncbi:MAG: DUF488 family protein [Candidatus Thorarchaeota archaeon]